MLHFSGIQMKSKTLVRTALAAAVIFALGSAHAAQDALQRVAPSAVAPDQLTNARASDSHLLLLSSGLIDPTAQRVDFSSTGAAADAVGLGLPTLRSRWGYLVEHLGDAGIPVGQSAESIAAALDALTDADLDRARSASLQRSAALDWSVLAGPTADLFDEVLTTR